MSASERPLLIVSGISEGFGASLAEPFARAGYDVAGISRSDRAVAELRGRVDAQGGCYTHVACDLSQPHAVATGLQPYASSAAVLVHNAHRLLIKSFEETSPDEIEEVWKTTCFSAMNAARAVLPHMAARGAGCVIMTGATASTRAGANFAAFAAAKFALRGFAQSLAREFGPKGVHVAHVIIDGLIDEPQTSRRFGPGPSQRLDAEAVAKAYLELARQDQSAWTHELDLRPFSEKF